MPAAWQKSKEFIGDYNKYACLDIARWGWIKAPPCKMLHHIIEQRAMRDALLTIRDRLDGFGVILSGLCAVHCVLGLVLVTALGLGGGALLSPAIHEVGLALAIGVGIVTLGLSAFRHGHLGPLAIGACGITLMAAALSVNHGPPEAVLTILGVALVAAAHIWNLRKAG